ncbi:hypothetical protein, partial [Hyphomonas sp.]|uniref:hypothetical protein n=1 Tax=Hyphomonas sp. TaxID=87 RepID=UPI0030F651F5
MSPFLKSATAIAAFALIAACGGSSTDAATPAASTETPADTVAAAPAPAATPVAAPAAAPAPGEFRARLAGGRC